MSSVKEMHSMRTDLETSRAPVNELDGLFGLDRSHGTLGVLGDNVTSVEETARHCKNCYITRKVG
jgi:hypothetical protein